MIDNLVAARAGFGMSLGFHVIFAALGVVVPFFLLFSEWLWLRRKNPVYLALNKKWTTAFAITIAVGAVSGTALSFELGLLWPRFMDFAGYMVGVPFSIEAYFFFLEAIFLGIYVFGRGVLSPWVHWLTGIPLAIGAVASLVAVVLVNAWMNTPVGFTLNKAGEVIDVDVLRAMFPPAGFTQVTHMFIAAFEAVAFAFVAVYAFGILRGRRDEYHKKALLMAMAVATLFAPIQIISGRRYHRQVHRQGRTRKAGGGGVTIPHPSRSADHDRWLAGRRERGASSTLYPDPQASLVFGL